MVSNISLSLNDDFDDKETDFGLLYSINVRLERVIELLEALVEASTPNS